jgi:hypothetical protein
VVVVVVLLAEVLSDSLSMKATTSFSIATPGKENGGWLMRGTARPSGVPAMPQPAGAPRSWRTPVVRLRSVTTESTLSPSPLRSTNVDGLVTVNANTSLVPASQIVERHGRVRLEGVEDAKIPGARALCVGGAGLMRLELAHRRLPGAQHERPAVRGKRAEVGRRARRNARRPCSPGCRCRPRRACFPRRT